MVRKIIYALLVVFFFIVQTSIFPAIDFNGITPNLLIILVASCGFMGGEITGMVIGLFCGLLVDVFNGDVIGFYACIYLVIGYINGTFQRIFYPVDIKLPLILILGSDIAFGLSCYLLLFLLRNRLDMWFYIKSIIIPEAVYTILVAFAAYPFLLMIHKKLDAAERRSNE